MLSRHASWSRVRNRDAENLTPRERACVDRERAGMSRAAIAAELGLAVSTVALHLWKASSRGARLRRKLRRYQCWTNVDRRTFTKWGTLKKC